MIRRLRRLSGVLPLVFVLGACGRSCGRDGSAALDGAAAVADPTDSAANAALARQLVADASVDISPAARRAYARAIGEGRKAQHSGKLEDAIAAFGRALVAVPDDPRAYAERGYARYQSKDLLAAQSDLERAGSIPAAADRKLAAQIEFNLGLVCEALAAQDAGTGDPSAAAAAHFRRSNELSPSAAAAARATPCPLDLRAPDVDIYPSAAAMHAALDVDGGEPLSEDNMGVDSLSRDTAYTKDAPYTAQQESGTRLIFPLDGGSYAAVVTGIVGAGRCGPVAVDNVVRYPDHVTVTYQERSFMAMVSLCMCGGESDSCSETWMSDQKPACKCKETVCQEGCGDNSGDDGEGNQGEHEEIVLDAKGRALVAWQTDTSFLPRLTTEVDTKAMRFRATGLNCAIDVPLPYVAP